jgi:hypothetical protein
MYITILNFETDNEEIFTNKTAAKTWLRAQFPESFAAKAWDDMTRYISREDWTDPSMVDGEWLEVNCHNSPFMVFPTHKVSQSCKFEMIVYWHESIAFGNFGNESVAFNFASEADNTAYVEFCKQKYLRECIQTLDELDHFFWHGYCDHDTEAEAYDCQEYQINEYCRDNQGSYSGMPRIGHEEIKEFVLGETS